MLSPAWLAPIIYFLCVVPQDAIPFRRASTRKVLVGTHMLDMEDSCEAVPFDEHMIGLKSHQSFFSSWSSCPVRYDQPAIAASEALLSSTA